MIDTKSMSMRDTGLGSSTRFHKVIMGNYELGGFIGQNERSGGSISFVNLHKSSDILVG